MPERRRQAAVEPRGRRERKAAPRTNRRRTNDEWSAGTTRELIRLARQEFATKGYAAASLETIATVAGLTKGSVYYHFGSKDGLFEAVVRDVQRDVTARIEALAGEHADPLLAVQMGCEAFLEIASDDAMRQVVLIDGPSVLGWGKWRAIDAEHGLGALKEGLAACRSAGAISAEFDSVVLAHWLSGALNEAVLMVAEASDRVEALAKARQTLRVLLASLAGAPVHARSPGGPRTTQLGRSR
jgi:AcrR family transcriptional regulator